MKIVVYSIGIHFPDNDFRNAIRGFLENFKNVTLDFSKEDICKIYNEMIYGCYLLYQRGIDTTNTKNYLEININQIFFNEEVLQKISENNTNHDFHYLDLYSNCIYTA